MFKMIAAVAACALMATPALANNGNNGNNGNNNPAGIAVGAIGGGFAAGTDVTFSGKGEGMSASGFQQTVDFNGASLAAFGSIGSAGSDVTVTPFSVDTNSFHNGAFAGVTTEGVKMEGTVSNFGQSEGSFKFDTSAYQHGEVGFGAFVGFGF